MAAVLLYIVKVLVPEPAVAVSVIFSVVLVPPIIVNKITDDVVIRVFVQVIAYAAPPAVFNEDVVITPALPLAVTAFVDSVPFAFAKVICPAPLNTLAAVKLANDPGAAPESINKPPVPLAMGKFPETKGVAVAPIMNLPRAFAGSGILTTDAWPIATLLTVVFVLPVLATPATINEPLDAVLGNDARVPAVPDNPAAMLPGFVTFAGAEDIVPVVLVKCAM